MLFLQAFQEFIIFGSTVTAAIPDLVTAMEEGRETPDREPLAALAATFDWVVGINPAHF